MPQFSDIVCLFLSELIRSRRTPIFRTAEIAEAVVDGLAEVKTEEQLLDLLSRLEKDFGEVSVLKEVLHFGHSEQDVRIYDREIREYSAVFLARDAQSAAVFLSDAARPDMGIQRLCIMYPDFCHFLIKSGALIPQKKAQSS